MNFNRYKWLFFSVCILSQLSCGGGGSGSGSASGSTPSPTTTTPTKPTIAVVSGVESATVSWPSVPLAAAYNIYYAPFDGVSKTNSTKLEGVSSPVVVRGLAAGSDYRFVATAVVNGVESEVSTQSAATPLPVAAQTIRYELVVRETKGISRDNEMIHNGVPIPKNLGLFDPSAIHLENSDGTPVDADFEVLARWGGGVSDSTKPIQWLLVSFRASVPANAVGSYFVVSGQRTNSGIKLNITEDINKIQVNTGAAQFSISKNTFNVLESLSLSSNPSVSLGGGALGAATIQVFDEGTSTNKPLMTAQAPTEVVLERVTDLFATVKVTGYFNNAPYAGVKWRYVARYNFFADSPTVILDFSYAMLGNKSGSASHEAYNKTDLIRIDKAVLSIPIAPVANTNNYAATDIGSFDASATGAVPLTARQNLRDSMTAAPSCNLVVNSTAQAGTCSFANRPFVGKWGASGGVGATIRQMRWYEPQSLNALAGQLDIEIVSEKQRLGPFMGAFAGVAITATDAGLTQLTSGGLRSLEKLDEGLFAWPTRTSVARSEVLDELWDGIPNTESQKYWDQLSSITANTASGYISRGMYGFMTYGLPVREWSHTPIGYSEFGFTSVWDGYYHGGTFTDYHNSIGNVVRQFAQSGDPDLLNTLSFPAARRMLHTQILQGDSTSLDQFYRGWAPVGYGGYRQNNNSSHSYFDNLYHYYYLTGDKTVLDTLIVAGKTLRSSYSRDASGSIIPSNLPPRQSFMGTVDRASSQQAAIFWFLGHASPDSTFIDDFRNNLDRGVDMHTALLSGPNGEYAFISAGNVNTATTAVGTDQVWMSSLYYLHNVWSYYREYGDVALGTTKLTIGRYFSGVNRSLWDYVSMVGPGGTGLPNGVWANNLRITWAGPIKGGTLVSATNPRSSGTSDDFLYLSGKSILPITMFRAARLTHSQSQYDRAKTMAQYIFWNGEPGTSNAANKYPWMKETSIRYLRQHGQAGYVAGGMFAGQ